MGGDSVDKSLLTEQLIFFFNFFFPSSQTCHLLSLNPYFLPAFSIMGPLWGKKRKKARKQLPE